ncbi:unnamed protein product [Danaus chrysippus]|uniref:(African queen) hypothetical protein n=1 Tax=Danaus chrysippus TaxID=151541 RepID=A0A8J2QNK3_9NEOP|nr:unnamed protein product [Danaus chrysippus]
MKSKHILLAGLILAQLIYVNCFAWAVVGIATSALGTIINVIDKTKVWTVEVHNNGKHHAHMWCASKDDKIGGDDGIWVKPGDKIMWSFRRHRTTQFWCNMDWYGQRVGWDVFVNNWKDAPNPTKWSIRNDGVYDQWRNRKWRNLNS